MVSEIANRTVGWLVANEVKIFMALSLTVRFTSIRLLTLSLFWLCIFCYAYYSMKSYTSKKSKWLPVALVIVCLVVAGDRAWVKPYSSVMSPNQQFKVVKYSSLLRGGWAKDSVGYVQLHKGWRILEEGELDFVGDSPRWEDTWVGVGNLTWQLR